MQKWEYCKVISIVTLKFNPDGSVKDIYRKAEIIRDLEEDRLAYELFGADGIAQERQMDIQELETVGKKLSQLGLKGWELASHTEIIDYIGDIRGLTTTYMLKRPIE